MTAAIASPTWPVSPAAGSMAWRFGREIVVAGPQGERRVLQWMLRRNCSISPRQMLGVYLSLCVLSLAVAGLFLWQGAPWVLAFAGVELGALGLAMLVFARHAGDRETLTLDGRALQVEQCVGPRVERTDFAADWLAVEPAAGQGSLVELSGQGRSVRVGRFLRPELRGELARELRHAVRNVMA